jgi:hypothetical protein
MPSFVHLDYPASHPGVDRFESAMSAAGQLGKKLDNGKGLAGVLLAAMAASLLVVADQLIETWADDGHMMAAWVLLWLVAFAAMAFLAPTTRQISAWILRALNAWSSRMASLRADERLWSMAQQDPRIMADLRSAQARTEQEDGLTGLVQASPTLAVRKPDRWMWHV